MTSLLSRLVRFVNWHRRPVAMLLAALAAASIAAAAGDRQSDSVQVLVASRSIGAGQTITAADVSLRVVPRSACPQQALKATTDAVGKTATAGATPGTPLTVMSVVTPKLAQASGRVLAPLRLTDADIAGYLSPGDVITITSATEAQAVTVARGARVVSVPQAKESTFGGDSRGVLVIVEVSPAEAQALAQAAAGGRLSVALS